MRPHKIRMLSLGSGYENNGRIGGRVGIWVGRCAEDLSFKIWMERGGGLWISRERIVCVERKSEKESECNRECESRGRIYDSICTLEFFSYISSTLSSSALQMLFFCLKAEMSLPKESLSHIVSLWASPFITLLLFTNFHSLLPASSAVT